MGKKMCDWRTNEDGERQESWERGGGAEKGRDEGSKELGK